MTNKEYNLSKLSLTVEPSAPGFSHLLVKYDGEEMMWFPFFKNSNAIENIAKSRDYNVSDEEIKEGLEKLDNIKKSEPKEIDTVGIKGLLDTVTGAKRKSKKEKELFIEQRKELYKELFPIFSTRFFNENKKEVDLSIVSAMSSRSEM